MLVLSCDDVPTNPLPVTERQAGIDVGIARFATLSDGTGVDNPRWGRQAGDRLTAAQRLARAKRRSKNRDRKRETVAARHRKFANRARTSTTNRPAPWSGAMTFWWWRTWRSPTWCGGPNPCPTSTTWGSFCPTVPGEVRA